MTDIIAMLPVDPDPLVPPGNTDPPGHERNPPGIVVFAPMSTPPGRAAYGPGTQPSHNNAVQRGTPRNSTQPHTAMHHAIPMK